MIGMNQEELRRRGNNSEFGIRNFDLAGLQSATTPPSPPATPPLAQGRSGPSGMIPEGDVAVARSLEGSAVPNTGQIEPFQRLPISVPEIAQAMQTLQTYRAGRTNLEKRIVENQQWYKLRQWECLRKKSRPNEVEPASAWLLNAIASKHADAMDNIPTMNVLPREAGDELTAKMLSSILPVVLDQCRFKQVYSRIMDDKLESGTGVYGVFWDSTKHNGLGDINITAVDLISLYWESGITDIQQSRNLFYVTLQDNDLLEQAYPQLKDRLSNPTFDVTPYLYDDTVDTNGKSAVVDWYYKKRTEDGRTLLHFCKFVAGTNEPLFATENEEEYADRGWYDHGLYPFVFDPLMRCKGTPTGFGYIDVGKGAQEYIDRGDQAVLQNMLFNARPRHFIRNDGAVNEEEFADVSRDFIHVDSSLGTDSILPVPTNPLNQIYVQILQNKIQELKETTGNRDVSNGGTSSGATAASAIAAMQEAGSKLSRDINQGSYGAFQDVILQALELIRQFYDVPRCFRILGDGGKISYEYFDNKQLTPQRQEAIAGGQGESYRLPLFDIEVTAEKQSPYTKMAQNELALQLYGAGFFAPNNADPALACLEMMDFQGRDKVIEQVKRNQTLQQMLIETQQLAMRLAKQVDMAEGSNLSAKLQQQFGQAAGMMGMQAQAGSVAPVEISTGTGESRVTRSARERAAEAAAPR